MNEVNKTVYEQDSRIKEAPNYPVNGSWMLFQCVLHGTPLCSHPECSGYDNRLCNDWRSHSGK